MSLSNAFYRVAYFLGLTSLLAWFQRNRVVVLCYHGVTKCDNKVSSDPWDLTIDVETFESQLEFLKKNYNVVSLETFSTPAKKASSCRRIP